MVNPFLLRIELINDSFPDAIMAKICNAFPEISKGSIYFPSALNVELKSSMSSKIIF